MITIKKELGLLLMLVSLMNFGQLFKGVQGAFKTVQYFAPQKKPLAGNLLPTVSVPLHLRLVALEVGVDDDSAAQAQGLPLPAERHVKLLHNMGLEGDAIFRHDAV